MPGEHELQLEEDQKAEALEVRSGDSSAQVMSTEAKERARRQMLRNDPKSSGTLKIWRPPPGSGIERVVHLWRYSFNLQNHNDKGKDAWYIAKLGVPPGSSGKEGDIDFYVTKALVRETTCRVPPGAKLWFTPSGWVEKMRNSRSSRKRWDRLCFVLRAHQLTHHAWKTSRAGDRYKPRPDQMYITLAGTGFKGPPTIPPVQVMKELGLDGAAEG